VLNEEAQIPVLLEQLQALRPLAEIILVDGGSEDASLSLAETYSDRVLVSARGRARQMNTGAACARGEYLFFLHCDTQLPVTAEELVSLLANKPLWGFFPVRLSGDAWPLRVVERMMTLRSCLTHIATGDQLLFIRRQDFLAMSGFACIPLMEDVEICRRLRRLEQPHIASAQVTTSSRRWDENGVLKTIVTMWRLRFAYWLGISPQRLVKTYYG
jgi:rSAM/selenodomain-associated transferase 2